MEIRKISTYKELDGILPLIKNLHDTQKYSNYSSFSGFLTWLMINFPMLGIWVAYEEKPIGYLIATIQNINMEREAVITECFIGDKGRLTNGMFNEIVVAWAKENGCSLLSCYTESDTIMQLLTKKYGFEMCRYYLTRGL